ncbi:hypothetical protein DL96DRAFT_70438 [Flagelloscypha sp. PMI_526]|nr:hypothetical protein DL96DRAFT_70438 [Flagelloscypha sp. PMI_526]
MHDEIQPPQGISSHPLFSLISACFWVLLWLLSWVKSLVALAPKLVYYTLSYSMTLTLDFWSFVLIAICLAVATNYWLRFIYLNKYTQLQEQPLNKSDAKELHPDVMPETQHATLHNYLDDFLQAVRVFGFLEKPVFHELTRHLQTRRLIAGDSLSLDEDKSFYCVIDGNVQVYTHNSNDSYVQEDQPIDGLQLLNEVGAGGTLSSLFTILSLFTEDVQMSWPDEEAQTVLGSPPLVASPAEASTSTRHPFQRADSGISQLNLSASSPRRSVSPGSSVVHSPEYTLSTRNQDSPSPLPRAPPAGGAQDSLGHRLRRELVARATEDSTLAVIPAEIFHRLTKKFPKASSHIVQVILTRFSRVTFNAAHKYLGLTSEVLRTEKAINDIAYQPLPRAFYEGTGLKALRQLFDAGTTPEQPESDYFAEKPAPINTPMPPGPLLAANSLQSDTSSEASNSPRPNVARIPSIPLMTPHRSSHSLVHAGDLLTSTDQGHDDFANVLKTPRVTRKATLDRTILPGIATAEDNVDLKEEVMSCIAKAIGLLQPPMSGPESLEASPRIFPADGRSPVRSSFSSLGSLSLFDLHDDGASSVTSTSLQVPQSHMTGLDNEVEILFFSAGSFLAKAGDIDSGLFYVIEGFLDILLPSKQTDTPGNDKPRTKRANKYTSAGGPGSQEHLFTVKPGGIAGYLSSLCHTPAYADIKAKTDVYVGFLSASALDHLLEKRPIVLLTLAKRLISLLSPLILHIDASLDWQQIDAGQVLWRPQDLSDSFYIVINGRLRAISETTSGEVSIVAEYGQGDTVGELDVITGNRRWNTLHAIRDTELIRMPRTLFNAISSRNPQVTAQILRIIASRVRGEISSSVPSKHKRTAEIGSNNSNLKTIALLPSTRHVPIEIFAKKLRHALDAIGTSSTLLNQASISSHLGRHVFTRMGKLKAAGWLADQEQKYRTVLYVADSPVNSPWTQTCIRQADFVLVVGIGDDPTIGEYERLLLSMKTTARKELVLLHPDRSVLPGSTRQWLKTRPWIQQHIHVYLEESRGLVVPSVKPNTERDPEAIVALRNLKERVERGINRYRQYRGLLTEAPSTHHPTVNDFARLARRICGRSIGLVLGGGGARGCAHLGLIRAMEEFGIPIDHIGGTSIGAFVGGLYAREGNIISAAGRAKQFSGRMGNIWRIVSDVTYPIIAYTTGHEFNRSIYKSFYDLHIEDMWLPFFCNTTNIMTSQMQIHENGYAWRFIRASMSLVGLLPPICDQGQLLVDGGYMDNLPVAAMISLGNSAVFACDVGATYDNSPRNIGDHVSGWWLLLNRFNPFSNARNIPDITEIQSRLAYAASVSSLEEAKNASNCLYVQMPVQDYGTLQFSKFEEIQVVGYNAAVQMLKQWEAEGRLPLNGPRF